MPPLICVVNKSTLVTATDVRRMTGACSAQAREHFAPAWGVGRPSVHYLADETKAPAGSWVLGVLDDADQAGALGWHSEDAQGRIYGRVFAKPSLDSGSTALTGRYAISATLSHEVLETLADPYCTVWADTYRGYAVSYEVCDPVEADGYEIAGVQVSSFVLPRWFDPQTPAGVQVDYLSRAAGPLHMTPGGYWVQAPLGAEQQKFAALQRWIDDVGFARLNLPDGRDVVFSPEMPQWRREEKLQALGRGIRKATGGGSAS